MTTQELNIANALSTAKEVCSVSKSAFNSQQMSIDEQKILIAKYLGLITETDGLWYLDNTHELKYDEDWNWIISAYKQIKKIEFEKIGTTDRIGDILRGIFNADIYQSFSSIYEYVNQQTQAVC